MLSGALFRTDLPAPGSAYPAQTPRAPGTCAKYYPDHATAPSFQNDLMRRDGRREAAAAVLLVKIQSGARILVGVVRVDLHEMTKNVVCEKAEREHAAVLRKTIQLSVHQNCASDIDELGFSLA
jgi:hypothetical protein